MSQICTKRDYALRRILISSLVVLTTTQPVMGAASSLPTNGTFVAGSGNITTAGNHLTINQSSLKGVINWKTFSIGQGASVKFNNGAGATLNRVTGSTPTAILGQLLASGSIYIINSQGVLIGHGATIHTGGDFLATTLNLPANSFLSGGPLSFSGSSTATVINLGNISSSGGSVYLIGRGIQNGGSVSAPDGSIGFAAGSRVLLSDGSASQKVAVTAPGGDITNSGFISAAQIELKSNGGNIYALAGNNGGQINATGTATQDGHVWLIAKNGTTNVSGTVSATNANGSGGAIETSGAQVVTSGAQLKTGKGGSWLLDPDDLTIDATLAGTIESSLNGGTNVTEQTTASGTGGSGDITVASNIAWTSGAGLTLSAYHNIGIDNGVTIANTGSGSLTLRADNASTGAGTIAFTGTGKIDFSASTGSISLLYNPSNYATPTDYSTNVLTNGSWTAPSNSSISSEMTAYMLVNNPTDLQNINANLFGAYALGQDFDAAAIEFTPLATVNSFSGILDGQLHTINNLTIVGGSGVYSGLFGLSSGIIRNINLANESVTGLKDIGGIVANNTGTIANASTSGTLGGNNNASNALIIGGGLAALNSGMIVNSSSDSAVNVSAARAQIGGLVGKNTGSIERSFASGAISLTQTALIPNSLPPNSLAPNVPLNNTSSVGGLVGLNSGALTDSYATGNISVTANNNNSAEVDAGGLTGQTDVFGTVASSFATGSVPLASAQHYSGGLFGLFSGAVTSSFWDTQTTGQSNAAGHGSTTGDGATAETTAALQTASLLPGFQSNIWNVNAGSYPFLHWHGTEISGTVLDGISSNIAATVDALLGGVLVGSAATDSHGAFSLFVPAGSIAPGAGVFTYLTTGGHGGVFSDSIGSNLNIGMLILTNALILINSSNITYGGLQVYARHCKRKRPQREFAAQQPGHS